MSTYSSFSIDEVSSVIVVRFDETDLLGTAGEIMLAELLPLVDRCRPQTLLFDFQHVKTFGSSLLGCLVRLKKYLDPLEISIKLCALPVPLRDVCGILNLTENVFQTFDSVSTALLDTRTR